MQSLSNEDVQAIVAAIEAREKEVAAETERGLPADRKAAVDAFADFNHFFDKVRWAYKGPPPPETFLEIKVRWAKLQTAMAAWSEVK